MEVIKKENENIGIIKKSAEITFEEAENNVAMHTKRVEELKQYLAYGEGQLAEAKQVLSDLKEAGVTKE